MKLRLSIVTVCYNAEKTIEATIVSILNQTYMNYEYIIVDGASTDRTNDIIKQYIPQFKEIGIAVKYISEKDNGIYDAMNKAIDMADGEWIAFMNADDSYYSRDVLEKVYMDQNYEGMDILYGSTNCVSESGQKIIVPQELSCLREGRNAFGHQASFVRVCYMKQKHFDCSMMIAADYKFFLEAWLEGKKFYQLQGMVIVNFSNMGLSTLNGYQAVAESRKIKYRHKIPGNNRFMDYLDYLWWVAVHLGGLRKGGRRKAV